MLAPAVLVCTTYFAMAANLVGRPISYVPYSIPTLIACIAATLDWRAGVLAVVNVGLAGAVYYPFVRIYERAERAREANGAAAA